MELLLWRWSTVLQITSAVMIAVFMVALARTTRRAAMAPWAWAWGANLVALGVTVTFWFAQPVSPLATVPLRFAYMAAKTFFVVLLVVGAWAFTRPPRSPRPAILRALALALAWGAFGALVVGSIDELGTLQSAAIALVCAAGALVVARGGLASFGPVALLLGFVARAALGGAEAVAYLLRTSDGPLATSPDLALFLASHSSLDTAAEWVIALGCVLTLYGTIQGELERANRELLASQRRLQGLVDLDPLTGLANRRSLPAVFRDSYETGATLLFFDLDGFKKINDTLGHRTGDACLVRFASALRATFRPGDHVLRYAGDEFLVVAPGVGDPEALHGRVEALRSKLEQRADGCPPLGFSSGYARLEAGGDPDAALEAADQAMYQAKRRARDEERVLEPR